MTTLDMFKKFGYLTRIRTNEYVQFKGKCLYTITFWFVDKTYDCEQSFIGIDLHKAITQQMKELGWIE